jgi:hypothetical protein
MDPITLQDMLIAAQNRDPDRLNPARDALLQILWGMVTAYRFRTVQERCIASLEKALQASDLTPLERLVRTAFPY